MIPRCRRHRWPLIVLGVLLLLGHVCALPFDEPLVVAHAEAGDAHGHDDALHAGSCEAVTTTTCDVWSPVPVVDAIALPSALAAAVADAAPHVDIDGSPPSPPLFLLHAALLI